MGSKQNYSSTLLSYTSKSVINKHCRLIPQENVNNIENERPSTLNLNCAELKYPMKLTLDTCLVTFPRFGLFALLGFSHC